MSIEVSGWIGRVAAPPPLPAKFHVQRIEDEEASSPPPPISEELEPISGFTCFIDYEGFTRRVVCRRFDVIGTVGYVGAICHSANGYRQFRIDKISAVSDALTGETLGNGEFFHQFAIDSKRERVPTWGLTPNQRASLIAGLNILAFMARCDGQWHPLESNPIESFICSMWLRKEWDGDPPLKEIVAHAQRLTPDSETFFRGLAHYARSTTSTEVLRRTVAALIEADGKIVDAEFKWALEFDEFFREYSLAELDSLVEAAHNGWTRSI